MSLWIHNTTGVKRAVKKLRKKKVRDRDNFFKEINFLKKIDHPHILNIVETFENDTQLYIVMDLCEGGELFDEIQRLGKFSEKNAADVMQQVLSALVQMHDHNICHRDLKPENFLLLHPRDLSNIKVIDLGLAEHFVGNDMKVLSGTPYQIAPEIAKGETYGPSCDMWSMGVILYIILSGSPPFQAKGKRTTIEHVKTGEQSLTLPAFTRCSAEAIDLIKKLLLMDPATRLTPSQALDHPFIKDAHLRED